MFLFYFIDILFKVTLTHWSLTLFNGKFRFTDQVVIYFKHFNLQMHIWKFAILVRHACVSCLNSLLIYINTYFLWFKILPHTHTDIYNQCNRKREIKNGRGRVLSCFLSTYKSKCIYKLYIYSFIFYNVV